MATKINSIQFAPVVRTGTFLTTTGWASFTWSTSEQNWLPPGWGQWGYRIYPVEGIYRVEASVLGATNGRVRLWGQALGGNQYSTEIAAPHFMLTSAGHFVVSNRGQDFINGQAQSSTDCRYVLSVQRIG